MRNKKGKENKGIRSSIARLLGVLVIALMVTVLFAQASLADISDGLVGYWPFDEGSGTTAYDVSGNGNDGTLMNGPTWTGDGRIGGALSLAGAADYVDIGNPTSLRIRGDITISTWFKTTGDIYQYDYRTLVSKWTSWSGLPCSYTLLFAYGGLWFDVVGEDNDIVGAGSEFADDGQWHHVAGTWDGETARIHVDGILCGSSSAPNLAPIRDTDVPVKFGDDNYGDWRRNYPGLLDEVRIYNRALSGPEVRELAEIGQPPTQGQVVVNSDEYTLSNYGFGMAPDTRTFALNVASWFTGSEPGNFLVYSNDFGLVESELSSTMTAAGHSWTIDTSIPFTLGNLLAYDAVFLGGLPGADNEVLIEYVAAGGNVYLEGGTGDFPGGAPGEAAQWNTFLNAVGLNFASVYNGIWGVIPTIGSHPIINNVSGLYFNNGNSVSELDPADPNTDILSVYAGQGMLAQSIVIPAGDTTPPEISVSVDPTELWPPNHKMKTITATVTATDDSDPSPTVVLTSIVSNEPDEGLGDGDKPNDIQDADIREEDYEFSLRAERSGGGDGRIYTITYTATDVSGNSQDASATVTVPHDKGKGKAAPGLLTFKALSAYPQPCNPEAWIPYTLAKDVDVTITIYNSSGRMIRTLQLGNQNAGAYISRGKAAYWDGKNNTGETVSSGVYFYRLKAGDFTAIKKLVVLR